jgi:hypothetical protein
MKTIQSILILGTLAAATAGAQPMPGLEWNGTSVLGGTMIASTVGWRFQVSPDSDIWVSALGVVDEHGTGLQANHDVAIWPAAGGAPIVTAVVPAGSTADLLGHFRYVNIPGVRLLRNTQYVIGADNLFMLMGDSAAAVESGYPPGLTLTNAQGVLLLADRWSAENFGTNHLVFPDGTEWTYPAHPAVWIGPNFLFSPAPPELSIRASQVELCWDTATNNWYQLQYQTTLTTNQWVPLMTNWFAGDGSRYCTNDAIVAGQVQRFYRLALTNSPPQ